MPKPPFELDLAIMEHVYLLHLGLGKLYFSCGCWKLVKIQFTYKSPTERRLAFHLRKI